MNIKKGFSCQFNIFLSTYQNIIYLVLIVFLGTAFRLYNLGTESFWFDEIITVHRVTRSLQTLTYQLVTQGNMTRNALYYLIAHFWMLPFEMTEISIRSLSVLFGVLSIGMMYLVGRQLFGEKVGLLSSFFMAVSEFQIQYSQEARFYSLFALLTLVSIYFYIIALRTKRPLLWIVNSLINVLLFYTHTYAIFIFAVEYIHYFIYLGGNEDTMAQWGVSQVLLVLAIVVGLIPLLREGSAASLSGGLMWVSSPSFKDLASIVYSYLFPQNYQHSWTFVGVSFAIGAIFFFISAFCFNFRKMKANRLAELSGGFRNTQFFSLINSEFMLAVIWFVCPIILPFIYSNLFSPILVGRYTICAAPAFYLLVAIVISRINSVIPVYISLGAMMIVNIPGLQDYYMADINEQWREVAAFVDENSDANDAVILAPDDDGYQTMSFRWYYQGALPSCGVSSGTKDEQTVIEALSPCLLSYDRYWVIMRGPSDVVNRYTSFFLGPNQAEMRLIEEKQFVMISVYLFESTK